jgi:hypothetical protein
MTPLELARSKGLERAVEIDPDAVRRAVEAAGRFVAGLDPALPGPTEFALRYIPEDS